MGKKPEYLERKLQPGQKALTFDPVKIAFFHYFFDERSAGVNRVVENNLEGLKHFYPNFQPTLIAEEFEEPLFNKHQRIVLDSKSAAEDERYTPFEKNFVRGEYIKDELINLKREFRDGFVAENPLRGIDAGISKGLLKFAEDDKMVGSNINYRNHDFFQDYPDDWIYFLKQFGNVRAPLPISGNVTQFGLTTSMQDKLQNFFDGEAEVLRNSVICDDFATKDDGKDGELRELFEREGIVKPGEKIIAYPVRIDQRKNVEEAIFMTHILNKHHDGNYRLIVTATRDKDYDKKGEENVYQRKIEKFAEELEVPVSLGEAYKFIDGENFNVGNLYHISDLALTTAVKEGFGYVYVEPWVSGTPLIGRRIREVCEDFEYNGLSKKNLYDGSDLRATRNWETRLKRLETMLKNPVSREAMVERLKLPEKIDYAKGRVDKNADIVKRVYGHIPVAREMIASFKFPGYDKLK